MKTTLYLALALMLILGCSSDDESAPPPDPREVFVGYYIAQGHVYNANVSAGNNSEDTTISVSAGPMVKIELMEQSPDKIALELENLIQEELNFAIGGTANFSEKAVAVVMEDGFQLENTYFEIVGSNNETYIAEYMGKGELTDEDVVLKFEYSFVVTGITVTFSGEVVLEKQQEEPQ